MRCESSISSAVVHARKQARVAVSCSVDRERGGTTACTRARIDSRAVHGAAIDKAGECQGH